MMWRSPREPFALDLGHHATLHCVGVPVHHAEVTTLSMAESSIVSAAGDGGRGEELERSVRFRPCIDLHEGKVKQIVGSTLSATGETTSTLETNFETTKSSADFAKMYERDGLRGGHVIMLGGGCEEAALAAIKAFPGGLQVGGGVNPSNAIKYLDAGASHVIVTSYVFKDGEIDWERLEELRTAVGKDRLVLDLSCRRRPGGLELRDFMVVTNKWQKFTRFAVTRKNLERLAGYCDEFLVHGVDAEGKMCGVLEDLVSLLGDFSPRLVTYAGGASSLKDLDRVRELGRGRVDLTIGSALDIFGGDLRYDDVVLWQRQQEARKPVTSGV
ncbi:unnamed protein product [Ectocarpus sp. 4 AP-2014]